MRSEPAETAFSRNSRGTYTDGAGRRVNLPPSASGYIIISVAIALMLSLVIWGVLHETNDEAVWAAALAACVVLLVAASARELIVRRAWSRHLLEADGRVRPDSYSGRVPAGNHSQHVSTGAPRTNSAAPRTTWSHSAALRSVQKRSAEADTSETPELHWDAYRLCQEYLTTTDEALRAASLLAEKRIAMRAGQERVRGLRKYHLLAWARNKTHLLTQEAQNYSRLHDKLDTAQHALQILDTALAEFPNESEVQDSQTAIREFMASARIRHWLEMAERTAFRGHFRRAVARYRDALFYVEREVADTATRADLKARIEVEITALKEKIANNQAFNEATYPKSPPSDQGTGQEI